MIYKFMTIDSTNTEAQRNINNYQSFDVLASKRQTNGYGRRGTAWVDSEGLFYTMILKNIDVNKVYQIPFISAYCVYKLLQKYNLNSLIKWPNDIIINNKKISGILVESKQDYLLIGIGLNIHPVGLEFATSLRELANYIEWDELVDELTHLLIENLASNDFNRIVDEINQVFYLHGKEIKYQEEYYIVDKMNYDGTLLVFNSNKYLTINSSDITLTNSYK